MVENNPSKSTTTSHHYLSKGNNGVTYRVYHINDDLAQNDVNSENVTAADGIPNNTENIGNCSHASKVGLPSTDGYDDENKGCLSVKAKWKDKEYRSKLIKTLYLAASASALGFAAGLRGPAFLDLQIITKTDIQAASFFFTAYSVGNLVGAIITGVVYDKLRWSSLLLLLTLLGMGVMTIALPWCSHFIAMVSAHFVVALFAGGLDTVSNAELMRLWGKEGEMAMQFLHFSYALGGIISPLVTEPFLGVPEEAEESTISTLNSTSEIADDVTHTNATASSYATWLILSTQLTSPINSSTVDSTVRSTIEDVSGMQLVTNSSPTTLPAKAEDSTSVHYAYMVCGVFILLVAVPFIYDLFRNKCVKQQAAAHELGTFKQPLPTGLFVCLIFIVCVFYFVYYCVEETFASLLATFVVKQLQWSKSDGAKISSVVWASSATGRFLSIFAVSVLSSAQLIVTCCVSMTMSLLGFYLLANYKLHVGVWVCTAVGAMSMGPIFATGFTWMEEELVRVNGRVVSAVMMASAAGNMVNPVLTGFLLQRFTPMWFSYLLLAESFLCLLVFLLLLAIARGYVARHFSLHKDLELEIEVPEVEHCTRL